MFRRCSVLIAVLLYAAVAQPAVNNIAQAAGKVRTWTNADGRTMEAEFVREVDGDVTFVKDGKLIVIRLDKLSQKDQQAVKDLSAGKEPADEDPFKTPEGKSASDSGSSAGGLFGDDKPNNSAGTDRPDKPKKPISVQTRTWTDRFGNKSTGKFVRMNGNDVVMNRGTKPVSVPFFNLSDADQDYVREVLISQGKEDAIPTNEFAGGGTSGGLSGSEFGQGSTAPGVPVAGGAPAPGLGRGSGMGPGPGLSGGMGPGMPGMGPMGPGMGRGSGMGPGMSGMGPGMSGMGPGMAGGPGGMGRGPGMRPPRGGSLGPGPMEGPGMAGGVVGGPMGTGPVGGINSGPPGQLPGTVPFDPSTAMAAGGMTGPGSMPGGMPASGMNPGMSSFPGSRMSNMPTMPSMEPASIPPLPSTNFPSMEVEEYYQCSKCNARLSKLEVSGTSCPRCNTVWGFKQDAFGNKTMTTAGRGQVGAAGTIILVFVLLGVVVFISLFIGIIVAIVKAASANAAPPPQPMPTRYY